MQGTDNSSYPRGLLFHTFQHDASGSLPQFSANVIKEELLSTDGSQISDSESSCSSKPSPAGMRGKNKRMRAQQGWVPHCSSTNSSSTGTSPASPTWPADPSPDSWTPEVTMQSRMELLQQKQDIENEIARLQGLLSQIDLKLQQHDQRLLFQRQSQQMQHHQLIHPSQQPQQQQQQPHQPPVHHFTIHNDTRSQPHSNKPFVLHQSFHYTPPSIQPAHPPAQTAPLYPLPTPQSPAAPHSAFATQFQQQAVPAVVVGTPLMQSMAASTSASSGAMNDDVYSKLRMPIDPISISLPSRPYDPSYLSPLVPPATSAVNFAGSFNLSDVADSQAASNAYSTAYFTNVSMPGLPAPESPLLSAHSASPSSLDEAAKSESEATGPDCENDTDSEMRSSMKGASPISPANDPIAIDQPHSLGSSLPFRYLLTNGQTVDPAHLDSVIVHEKKKTVEGFPIKEVRPDRNSDSYRLHLRNGFVAQHALAFAQHQHGRPRPFVQEALPNLTVRSVSTMTSSQQRDDLLLSLPSHLFNSMRHGHMVIMDTLVAVDCKVFADGRREAVPGALLRLPNASFAIRCKRSGRDPDRWTLTDFPSSGGGPPRSSDDDSSGDDSSRSRGPRSGGPKGGAGAGGRPSPNNGMNRFVNVRAADPSSTAPPTDPVAPTADVPTDCATTAAAAAPAVAAATVSTPPAVSPLRRRRSSRRGRVSVPPVNVTLASSDSDDGDVSGNLALSSRQQASNTSRTVATPPQAPSTPVAQVSQCGKSLEDEKDSPVASDSKQEKDIAKPAAQTRRWGAAESMQVGALLLCVAAAATVNPIAWDLTLWGVLGVSVLFITALVTRQWADCKRITLKAVRAVAVALGQADTPILSGRAPSAPPAPAPAQTDLFTHGVSVAGAEANLAVRFPALTCAIDIATRSSVYLALSFLLFRENLSFASLAFAVGWSLFARVSGEPALWREFTHEQGAFWRSSFSVSDPHSWFAVVHAALFIVFLNGPASWRRFSAVIAPAFFRGKVLRLLPLVFAGATASEWFFSAPNESLPEAFNSESSLNRMAGAVLSASTLHDLDIYSASPSELAQVRWHAFLLVARCVALVLAPVIFIYWFPLQSDREGSRARSNSNPVPATTSPSASEADLPSLHQSPFRTHSPQPVAVAE